MLQFDPSDPQCTESDVFCVERLLGQHNLHRSKTSENVNSTHLSGAIAREVITISSVAPPEPQGVTIESNSIVFTLFYGYGRQQPEIRFSLTGLKLLGNAYNVMTPISPATITDTPSYSNVNDDVSKHEELFVKVGQFKECLEDIFRGVEVSLGWTRKDISCFEPLLNAITIKKTETKTKLVLVLSKKSRMSQHTCQDCGQPLPTKKTTQGSYWDSEFHF